MPHQDHRVNLQPAFILHSRAYRDTSHLLDVFSRDFGRVTLVAKGSRSPRSKLQGILQVFTPLIISWVGKGEVQTLTAAEIVKNNIDVSGKHIISAYYINELIQRLVIHHDPHPILFSVYQRTLENFLLEAEELVLRRFEKLLLADIGYGLSLVSEAENGDVIDRNSTYYYDLEKGPININRCGTSDIVTISGQTLWDLEREEFTSRKSQNEAKQLMRTILNYHLGGKPLKTRKSHWYTPL